MLRTRMGRNNIQCLYTDTVILDYDLTSWAFSWGHSQSRNIHPIFKGYRFIIMSVVLKKYEYTNMYLQKVFIAEFTVDIQYTIILNTHPDTSVNWAHSSLQLCYTKVAATKMQQSHAHHVSTSRLYTTNFMWHHWGYSFKVWRSANVVDHHDWFISQTSVD